MNVTSSATENDEQCRVISQQERTSNDFFKRSIFNLILSYSETILAAIFLEIVKLLTPDVHDIKRDVIK